jgi:hypothetical protein
VTTLMMITTNTTFTSRVVIYQITLRFKLSDQNSLASGIVQMMDLSAPYVFFFWSVVQRWTHETSNYKQVQVWRRTVKASNFTPNGNFGPFSCTFCSFVGWIFYQK